MICSAQASLALGELPEAPREAVRRRLDYLRRMPRMYAMAQDERFPGCRAFWVDPCYRVFYMVAAGGDDVYVAALVREEVDEPGDGSEL